MNQMNIYKSVAMLNKAIEELDGMKNGWDVVECHMEDPHLSVEILALIHLSKKIADKFPNDDYEKMEKRFYSHLYNVDYT